MASCDVEFSSLPLLTGCPLSAEYFLVGNAVGGTGTGLYGRRLYSDLKNCILQSLHFVLNQFKIGSMGSPMNVGDTVLTINQSNIVTGSVFITLSGPEIPQSDNTQVSYSIIYNSNDIVITFDQPVSNLQTYIIHYAYTS